MADPFDFEKPRRFAVMGNPVSHSKSPLIHKQFAQQFKHAIDYTAIQVDIGGLPQAVEQFRAHGGNGLNITVPFKLDAFRLAEHLSDRAQVAQAVNLLRFDKDGSIFGDNTDGAGLVHDIQHNLGVGIKDKRVLVLGAGGAVRGVLAPLLKHGPAQLSIANRTVAKARNLARELAESSDAYLDKGTMRAILELYRSADPDRLGAHRAAISRLAGPSLVLWGDEDPYLPPRFGDSYGEMLGTRAEHLPKAGHWPWLDQPGLVDRVAAFIEWTTG